MERWGDDLFEYEMWPVKGRPKGLITMEGIGYNPVLLFDPRGEICRQTTNTKGMPGLYKIISGVPENVADKLNELMEKQNGNKKSS